MQIDENIHISRRALEAAISDGSKAAKAMHLIYVNPRDEGLTRRRRGKNFYYLEGNQRITEVSILDRIRRLVIPPAWENVWICKIENGHLQVIGIDALGRKQYRYHPLWSLIRSHTKFYRMLDFGQRLPMIRSRVEKALSLSGFPKEKILALVVSLLERTSIRIGNSQYEKLYGSFGLTTMKNDHVEVIGTQVTFSFKGKKGVFHEIGLKGRRIANIIKGCKDIPGHELFEYIDSDGSVHKIDSGIVNEYLHTISEGDFSAKDFRTWTGTVQALIGLKEIDDFETTAEMNRKIAAMYDGVAEQLGNTRAVCKKHYVHPLIITLYTNHKLGKYLEMLNLPSDYLVDGLSSEESLLLEILKEY